MLNKVALLMRTISTRREVWSIPGAAHNGNGSSELAGGFVNAASHEADAKG